MQDTQCDVWFPTSALSGPPRSLLGREFYESFMGANAPLVYFQTRYGHQLTPTERPQKDLRDTSSGK